MSTIYSRPALRKLIDAYGIRPQKRWGQNFLVDRNSALKIVDALPQAADSVVWEIGPGFGALTEIICSRFSRVVVFEIDRALISYLNTRWPQLSMTTSEQLAASEPVRLSSTASLSLVSGDALRTLPQILTDNRSPDVVIGNLPYNSAARILLCLACSSVPPPILTVTIQREVAERLTSHAGKNYSSFSVLMQLVYHVERIWTVPRTVFYPTPHVESSCVQLIRNDVNSPAATAPAAAADRNFIATRPVASHRFSATQIELVAPLVRAAFHSRRATLHKNLSLSPQYREAYRRLCEQGAAVVSEQQRPGRGVTASSSASEEGGVGDAANTEADNREPLEILVRKRAEQLKPQQFVQLAKLLQQFLDT